MWTLKFNSAELALSFTYTGSRDGASVIRLGSKRLYLLSHLTNPNIYFGCIWLLMPINPAEAGGLLQVFSEKKFKKGGDRKGGRRGGRGRRRETPREYKGERRSGVWGPREVNGER